MPSALTPTDHAALCHGDGSSCEDGCDRSPDRAALARYRACGLDDCNCWRGQTLRDVCQEHTARFAAHLRAIHEGGEP